MDYENQKMVEFMFNEKQAPRLIRQELLSSRDLLKAIENAMRRASFAQVTLHEEFCLDFLTQLILLKRTRPEALIGMLRHHFNDDAQKTADAVYAACHFNLADYNSSTHQVIVSWNIDEKTEGLIRQYQYMPPMLIPPLPAGHSGDNRGSGYLTITMDSLMLQDQHNHHGGWLCTDALDSFNSVPLTINPDIVRQVRNRWKGLDKPKPGENWEDYRKRVKAFERYERDSFFTIALMIEMGNRFHVTHKVDKRGRVYAQGYHINPQGNCWNKACIELADKELVNWS